MYYVYIVRCKDGSLYTGYSVNVKRRIIEHNTSRFGAKSLRGKRPVKLVYIESFKLRKEATKREAEIKSWKKEQKEKLV